MSVFRITNKIPPGIVRYGTASQATSSAIPDRSGRGSDAALSATPTADGTTVSFNGSTQFGSIPGTALSNIHTGIGTTTDLSPTDLLYTHPQAIIWTATHFYVANTQAGAGSEFSLERRSVASPNTSDLSNVTLKADAQAIGMDSDITHIGGGCLVNGVIYLATDDWTEGGTTIAGILAVDPETLEPLAWYPALGGVTEISGLAFRAAERVFYASSYDSPNVRKIAGPGHAQPIGTLIDTIALATSPVDPLQVQDCTIVPNVISGVEELYLARGGAGVEQPVYTLDGAYIRTYRNPATHSAIDFHGGSVYVLGSPQIEYWSRVDEIADGFTAGIWVNLGAGAISGDQILGQWASTGVNQRGWGLFVNSTLKIEARISDGSTSNVVATAANFNAGTMEFLGIRHVAATNTLEVIRMLEGAGALTIASISNADRVIAPFNRPLTLFGVDPTVTTANRPPGVYRSDFVAGRAMSNTELLAHLANGPAEPFGTVETNLAYTRTPGQTLTLELTNLSDDAATPQISHLPDGWIVVTNDEIASGASGNLVLRAGHPTRSYDETALIGGNVLTLRINPAMRLRPGLFIPRRSLCAGVSNGRIYS